MAENDAELSPGIADLIICYEANGSSSVDEELPGLLCELRKIIFLYPIRAHGEVKLGWDFGQ